MSDLLAMGAQKLGDKVSENRFKKKHDGYTEEEWSKKKELELKYELEGKRDKEIIDYQSNKESKKEEKLLESLKSDDPSDYIKAGGTLEKYLESKDKLGDHELFQKKNTIEQAELQKEAGEKLRQYGGSAEITPSLKERMREQGFNLMSGEGGDMLAAGAQRLGSLAEEKRKLKAEGGLTSAERETAAQGRANLRINEAKAAEDIASSEQDREEQQIDIDAKADAYVGELSGQISEFAEANKASFMETLFPDVFGDTGEITRGTGKKSFFGLGPQKIEDQDKRLNLEISKRVTESKTTDKETVKKLLNEYGTSEQIIKALANQTSLTMREIEDMTNNLKRYE